MRKQKNTCESSQPGDKGEHTPIKNVRGKCNADENRCQQQNIANVTQGERTPFKDLTNNSPNETLGGKQGSGTHCAGQLSADKKEEHLEKLQIARQQKQSAEHGRPAEEPRQIAYQGQAISQNAASSFMDGVSPSLIQMSQQNASEPSREELTPVKQTNSLLGRQNSSGGSRYSRLSAEKKEEYLRKQRENRQLKKGQSISLNTASIFMDGVSPTLSQMSQENASKPSREELTPVKQTMGRQNSSGGSRYSRLSAEKKEEKLRKKREKYHLNKAQDREVINAERRASRQAKRNTPCAESIAMMCPSAASSESLDMDASGYFVFYIMLSWTGQKLSHPICMDVYELRKKFLVHLLKYAENEVEDNIPHIVRQYLGSIME